MARLGESFTQTEVDSVFAYVANGSDAIGIAELQAALAIYQRKYVEAHRTQRRLGKAHTIMTRIYAKRLGLDSGYNGKGRAPGSSSAKAAARAELAQLRHQSGEDSWRREARPSK
jgi:hypothetical protein